MQVDSNPFPMHTVELQNPKVLIRPNQAESTKGKNVIIGEPRPKHLRQSKEIPAKRSPEASSKSSTLGGQDQKKGTRSVKIGLTDFETGLTGPSGSSALGGASSKKVPVLHRPVWISV